MSLLSNSSIALLPDGGKAGKLYSLIPSDGTGDFTVVRALDTATRVNENGLIEVVPANVPRIDFAEGTGCGSLLVEPQETIAIGSYGNFSTGSNIILNTTLINDFQGSYDTFVVQSTAGDTNNGDNRYTASTGDGTFNSTAFSGVFFKLILKRTSAGTHSFGYTSGHSFSVNLDTGLITGGDYQEFINLGNDYYQVNVGFNSAVAGSAFSRLTVLSPTGVGITLWHISEGYNVSSSIIINTTSATRNADVISLTGVPELLGDSEGTLMVESKSIASDSTAKSLSISDNSLQASYRLRYTSSNTIEYNLISGGSTQFSITDTATDINTFSKNLFTYKNLDYKLVVDGILKGTNTAISNTGLNSLTTVSLNRGGSGEPFYGRIKSLLVYQAALDADAFEVLSGYATYAEMALNKNYTVL